MHQTHAANTDYHPTISLVTPDWRKTGAARRAMTPVAEWPADAVADWAGAELGLAGSGSVAGRLRAADLDGRRLLQVRSSWGPETAYRPGCLACAGVS